MQKSEQINEIAKALALFQVKMDKIQKDAKNPFFKSKYATLSNILENIKIPLTECGLSFSQFPSENNSLTTILMHGESGQYICSTYNIQPIPERNKEKDSDGNITWRSEPYYTPQAIGSAITYARRYALCSILGLNVDDDDDGNIASGKATQNTGNTQNEDNRPWLNENTDSFVKACDALRSGIVTIEKIEKKYKLSKAVKEKLTSLK